MNPLVSHDQMIDRLCGLCDAAGGLKQRRNVDRSLQLHKRMLFIL